MDEAKVPEAVRVDAAKVVASKGLKKLPDGGAKLGKKADPMKVQTALHYLEVSLAIHEDATVRQSLARCQKLLGTNGAAKTKLRLDDIPEAVRIDIRSALVSRGMSKLPTDWVSEKHGVPPEKLQVAVHYLELANAIEPGLTVLNWRAQCLKLMGRWDDAIAAFRELMAVATGDMKATYAPLAERGIRECEKGRRAKTTAHAKPAKPTTSKKAAPAADAATVELATSFADALVAADFGKARVLLSRSLKKAKSEQSLARSVKSLLPSAKSKLEDAEVVETLTDWPDKQQGDVGWVYVALNGDGFSEGVSVTVSREGSRLAIRDVEWGRP
jgi:hypothetical protein